VDFIEWCDLVLGKLTEAMQTTPDTRIIGVDLYSLARTIFEPEFTSKPEFQESTQRMGILDAMRELKDVSLIESSSTFWKATKHGRELAREKDWIPLWEGICQERLEPEEKHLLKIINKLSHHSAIDHAWLSYRDRDTILAELGWSEGIDRLLPVSEDLEQAELIQCRRKIGKQLTIQATYRGLVWETRRGFTVMAKFIDGLRAEGETTSVEFKRELHLHTADEKAECIKDILSLANTKASGRRWLVIGFDNKSLAYYRPPDSSLNQNRFEQLLAVYTKPYVDVRYEAVDYRDGPVGVLEVLREPGKLPYKVAKSIGDKKRIEEGNIYVRHGSQVEQPTPDERQALIDEGNQARASNP
jgi:hypothetical protein